MPGHAKTLVAAYLISSSGTAWHAVLLAIVVTITHTALVVIVGLIIWFYQRTHPQIGPTVQLWLGTIAGLLVAGMGLSLLRRAVVGGHHHGHSHGHHHHHPHPHEHHHDHPHPHDHDHVHPHDHSHDHGHEHHDHAPSDRVTVRMLLLLGVTGGLVPCPTATIIMLLGIGANVVLGSLYAVLVFSLGLALTLMAVGFLALSSRHFASRLMKGSEDPASEGAKGASHHEHPTPSAHWLLNRLIPALSGLAVLALGAALTAHYLHLLRTGLPLFSWLQ
jgi:nickel/cobalt exporter